MERVVLCVYRILLECSIQLGEASMLVVSAPIASQVAICTSEDQGTHL